MPTTTLALDRRALRATFAVALSALVLAACGGGGGGGVVPDSGPQATINQVSAEAAGERCPAGGVRIVSGFDDDGDGVLDDGEVTDSEVLCNGMAGSSGHATLMSVRREAAGAHCASGGMRVASGLDADDNGVLAASEVELTRYVCNGTSGTNGSDGSDGRISLVRTSSEAAGANCAHGGTRIEAGVDADGNGALAAGEVSSTAYVCDPPPNAGVEWVDVAAASVQAEPNIGYHTTGSSDTTITLPTNASLGKGDLVAVAGVGTGAWTLAQNAGQRIYGGNLGHVGASWKALDDHRSWQSVACSADGSKLAAVVYGGQVYLSSDSGSTWTAQETSRLWYSIAMTPDGSTLVAAVPGAQLHTSYDGGSTWTARESARSWYSVSTSDDGQTMVAAAGGDQIYTSNDGGATWTGRDSSRLWFSTAISADGLRMVAAEYGGQIYTSIDAGLTWTHRETNRAWAAVTSSADGMKLAAVVFGGSIFTSSDAGVTWQERITTGNWITLSSSRDGRVLVAGQAGGQVYTSEDGGVTWTPRYIDHNWSDVCVSGDGRSMVALEHGGMIHLSSAFSTTGVDGGLRGGQYDTIELQYLGDGLFIPLSHEGVLTLY